MVGRRRSGSLMSERYGICKNCAGIGSIRDPILFREVECAHCGGTGFSGSANHYYQKEYGQEMERDHDDFLRNSEILSNH